MKKSYIILFTLCFIFVFFNATGCGQKGNMFSESATTIEVDSEISQSNYQSSLSETQSEYLSSDNISETNLFDMSGYKQHGDWSCDRMWVLYDNWDDELDESVEEFAYLNRNGLFVTPSFGYKDFEPRDYRNNYLMIVEKKKPQQFYYSIYAYDHKGIELAHLETTYEYNNDTFTDFNKQGIALVEGREPINNENYKMGLFWIDKNGYHFFEDKPQLWDINNFEVTDKYMILGNKYITDRNGDKVIDFEKELREIEEFNDKYNIGAGHDFRNLQLNGNEASFEFCAENRKSNNEVWFSCTMSLNGNIIKNPEKLNN